jgi:hypothetical protein
MKELDREYWIKLDAELLAAEAELAEEKKWLGYVAIESDPPAIPPAA